MKRCWKCGTDKPIGQFAKNRSKSSGRAAECKGCVAAYNKQHVAKNAAYYKQYRQAKRHANLAWYLFLECRSRAKRNGLAFNLTPDDIGIPTHCPVFGFPLVQGGKIRDECASVDRINSALGYVKGNVRVISYLANRMKSNASAEQLETFAKWVLETKDGSTQERVDTPNSPRADQNQHVGEAPYQSRTWRRADEQDPGTGCTDPLAQVSPGPQRH